MRIHRLLSAAALALCSACCSPTGSDTEYERMPGVLATSIEGELLVEVPASANAGQTFSIRVATQGSSCRRGVQPDVERAGLQVEVRIWEEHPVGGGCDRALMPLEHHVALRFDQPGTATVRIHGLADTVIGLQPVVVERTVTIQ